MKLVQILLGLILSVFMASSYADAVVQSPVDAMQKLTTKVQQEIATHTKNNSSTTQLYGVLKKTLLPNIDVDRMAGMTLGPKWRSATAAEKQQFIDLFGLTLTRAFAGSLSQAADYKITLNPMRTNKWQTAQTTTVNGTVLSKESNEPSHITYYLERSGNGWKIYDFAVEGVSVVKNYQSQFQSYPSMAALMKRLEEINQA